jgi:hypothetical protein
VTKNRDEAVERAARARAESRAAFGVALRWRKLRRARSEHLVTAEALCLVRSIEMGLKALALFEAGRASQGHELRTLVAALSPDLRSQIIRDTGDPAEQFDSNLDALHRAFDESWNAEAHEPQLVDFLERLARAVQNALYGHPSAARKNAEGPAREASGDDHMAQNRQPGVSCSFCGKGLQEIRKLIAGPTVYICDECVSLCSDIIAEELAGESRRLHPLEVHAKGVVATARSFAEACEKAVELPRPVAERARALAEEIEVVTAASADSRVAVREYAKGVAVMARHFAKACDAVELPRAVAERARALFVEIEALMGPSNEDQGQTDVRAPPDRR